MTGVETIARIRFEHYQNGKGIKRIARELGIARDTVRKVLRSNATAFTYKREVQPQPKLGPWVPVLTAILEAEAKLPRRERRSTQRLFEELHGRGYDGAHDSVHRFVKAWRAERARVPIQAFIPLRFDPGEAYQFDWSHEGIEFSGIPLTEGGADAARLQPHALRAGLFPRDPRDGLRRPRQGVRVLRRGVPARSLRQHEDGGRGRVCRPGPRLQPAFSATVLAPSRRPGRLYAGGGLGEGPRREPGRHRARPPVPTPPEGDDP
jgi:hypothetical protein